jgi:hypothetical protein
MKEHDETDHLLSTKANKERLLEDVFNDEKRQGVKELIDAQKQETLEEAAFNFTAGKSVKEIYSRMDFIKGATFGAKWQQIQDKNSYLNGYIDGSRAQAKLMYSEQDMRQSFNNGAWRWRMHSKIDIFKEWLIKHLKR